MSGVSSIEELVRYMPSVTMGGSSNNQASSPRSPKPRDPERTNIGELYKNQKEGDEKKQTNAEPRT